MVRTEVEGASQPVSVEAIKAHDSKSGDQASIPLTSMAAPKEFLSYIDKNAESFIKRLAEAVAIPRHDNSLKTSKLNT